MKLGMNLPVMVPGLDRELVLEWCRRIDAGPYESLAAGERITFPNPEITVVLSAAAVATERVKLVFGVLVLPLHSAVLVAKQVATLDVLSEGRVVLGVGAGGRDEDYRALSMVPEEKRLTRLEQQVAEIRRAWRGEHPFEGALRPVEPAPLQGGSVTILAGSIFPRAIRRAARWADGLYGFSFGPGIDEIDAGFETARTAWREAGRERPPTLATGFWFALGEKARDQMDAYLGRYLDFMGPGVAAKIAPSVTSVSAAALRDAARRIQDLGADELILTPTTLDPDEVDRVADILG
jgi:alkanesulfonate monooxygenase SsuD/methylene tetrahydromethanopterin reductase-like flavin-dependent oxidoreductase (luciferase family)